MIQSDKLVIYYNDNFKKKILMDVRIQNIIPRAG